MMHLSKLLRAGVCVAVLTVAVPQSVPAQDDNVDSAAYAAAVQLLEVSTIGNSLDQLVDQVGAQLVARIEQLVPAIKGQAAPVVREVLTPLWAAGRDQIMHEVAKAYARRLTADELAQVAAFYATPAGRKLSEVQPALQEDVARIGRQWAQAVANEINRGVRAKLKALGHEF